MAKPSWAARAHQGTARVTGADSDGIKATAEQHQYCPPVPLWRTSVDCMVAMGEQLSATRVKLYLLRASGSLHNILRGEAVSTDSCSGCSGTAAIKQIISNETVCHTASHTSSPHEQHCASPAALLCDAPAKGGMLGLKHSKYCRRQHLQAQ